MYIQWKSTEPLYLFDDSCWYKGTCRLNISEKIHNPQSKGIYDKKNAIIEIFVARMKNLRKHSIV